MATEISPQGWTKALQALTSHQNVGVLSRLELMCSLLLYTGGTGGALAVAAAAHGRQTDNLAH